jgi:hypothetical protein
VGICRKHVHVTANVSNVVVQAGACNRKSPCARPLKGCRAALGPSGASLCADSPRLAPRAADTRLPPTVGLRREAEGANQKCQRN